MKWGWLFHHFTIVYGQFSMHKHFVDDDFFKVIQKDDIGIFTWRDAAVISIDAVAIGDIDRCHLDCSNRVKSLADRQANAVVQMSFQLE